MPDSERDKVSSAPPPGIRSVHFPEPVSGFREERTDPDARVNDTELSVTRPTASNPDTLMSLPKPLPHDELPYEMRLKQLEDRVETLTARLYQVQRGSIGIAQPRGTPWCLWLLFLLGLAVTWRVLASLR